MTPPAIPPPSSLAAHKGAAGRVAPGQGAAGRVALGEPERAVLAGDPLEVGPWLLHKVLVHGGRAGRIVEVEAYRGRQDPASHAFRGQTRRNATMFGRPGLLYVYFTYGMHFCANVVCGPQGTAGAVLLRALAPLEGLEEMARSRPAARRPEDLCSGPAKLCAALSIDRGLDGADLVTGQEGVRLVDDGTPPPPRPGRGPRIGVSRGAELPWRFWVPGDPHLSRPDRLPRVGGPRGSTPGLAGAR